MAQLVLSAAGAVVGFFVGGPAGASWGWMAGSLLGSLTSKSVQRNTQQLGDLRVTGTDYGQAIPYARGTVRIAGQTWWNSQKQPIYTTTVSRQGKGGGQKTETTTITYKIDVLFGLVDLPIAGITKVFDNGKLIWHIASDAPAASVLASGQTDAWDDMIVYDGSPDQLPDPTYLAAVTSGPAYRDRGSVFIKGLNLGQSGQMRNLTFEVVIDGASTGILEREWGGMGTSVLFGTGQEIAFDPDRNELWTNYVAASSNGIGTTGRVAVYNLDDEAWTFIDPPAGYSLRAATNASIHAFIAYGKFYTQVRRASDLYDTTAIYDIATKTVLGVVIDFIGELYAFGLYVSAIDAQNNTMLMETGENKLDMYSVVDGVPGTRLLFSASAPTSTAYVSTVDNSGRYWVNLGNGLITRVTLAGYYDVDISPYKPATSHSSGSWVHDSFRDCIYFFSTHDTYAYLYRFDCTDETVEAVNSEAFNTVSSTNDNYWVGSIVGYDEANDRIVLKRGYEFSGASDFRLAYLNPSTGVIEQVIQVSDSEADWGGGNVPVYGGFVWGLAQDLTASPNDAGMAEIRFAGLADDPPSVQEVVRDLLLRAELTSDQFDVSQLSSITRKVKCLPVAQISTTAGVIDLLAGNFFFDLTCDDKLRFIPRGGAPVATIEYEELGASFSPDSEDEPFELKERSDIEIPAQIALTCLNIDDDYEPVTEMSDRINTTVTVTIEPIDIPLGMTAAELKAVADVNILDQSVGRWTSSLSLLGDHSRLQPGDVVLVNDKDGSQYRMRSVYCRDSYPVVMHDVVLDDATILESQGITSADYTPSTIVAPPIRTSFLLLDIPILQDADADDSGFYAVVKPRSGTAFPGAAIFESTDDVEYDPNTVINDVGVFGTAVDALDDWTGPRVIDEYSSVVVSIGEGTLSSSTRDAVLASEGVNAFLLGDEICQFITATLISAGRYKLTRLIRGSRGTERAMTGHLSGERFVLLRDEGIGRVFQSNSQIGQELYYKAVTLGRAVSSASSETFTNSGIGRKPFSPFDLRASRDASNNLTVTWQRRTRLAVRKIGALGISVPLGEEEKQYAVEFLNNDTDMTVQKTAIVTTEQAEFTSAEQVAAGIPVGQLESVYVKIYQLSAVVGRGFALEGAV